MSWYGSGKLIPPGEDVLIVWPDEERTTIKAYGPWRVGEAVRINGTTQGKVVKVDSYVGGAEVHIKSSSGNRFSFTFGD